jgi:glutamine amidotransferase
MKVWIADYGAGNLESVCRGFRQCGAEIVLAADPAAIGEADRLVVPGVGAFAAAMARLKDLGLADPIRRYAELERPLLGICVGMQMLLDGSDEFGLHKGLEIIHGDVRRIPSVDSDGTRRKIPHIGWCALGSEGDAQKWHGTILDDVTSGESVYFVHSYTAWPTDEESRLADTDYDGSRIAAVVNRGAIYGCQFHPEKSGPVGLRILNSFLNL